MNCNRCGAQNDENNTFCSECGMILRTDQQRPVSQANFNYDMDEDVDSNPFIMNPMAGNLVANESVYQPLDMQEYQASESNPANMIIYKSSKKKVFLILSIIIAILLILGAGAFFFFPKIASVAMSPQKYYALAEKTEIEETYQSIKDIMQKYYTSSGTITSDFAIVSNASSAEASLLTNYLSLLENMKITGTSVVDNGKKRSKNSFDITYNNKSVASILMQEDGNKVSVAFPNLAEGEYISGSFRWYADLLLGNEKTLQEMTGMSKRDFNKLVTDIMQTVLFDSIQEENVLKAKAMYEGTECRTVTFVIDHEVQKRIMLALANELETNVELNNLIKSSVKFIRAKLVDMDPTLAEEFPTEEEVVLEIKDTIADLENGADAIAPGEKGKYTIYYGKFNNILAREYSNTENGVAVSLGKYKKDNQNIMRLALNDGTDQVVITNTYEQKGKMVEGKFIVTSNQVNENQIINATYQFEKDGMVGGVPTLVGEMKMEVKIPFYAGESQTMKLLMSNKRVKGNQVQSEIMIESTNAGEAVAIGLKGNSTISSKVNTDDIKIGTESTLHAQDLQNIEEKIGNNILNAMGYSNDMLM